MPRVAPAFDPSSVRTGEMRDGDVINLDVGAILAHRPDVAAGIGAAMDSTTSAAAAWRCATRRASRKG